MLIDEFLPEFDVIERHRIQIQANPDAVYSAVLNLDLGRSPVVRSLFRLRGLPAQALTLDGLLRTGFLKLAEEPQQELLLGLVGQFWKPAGSLQRATPETFKSFRETGYAKTAWNFHVAAHGPKGTLLTTETRVLALDAGSRWKFRLYWTLIGPFSGWIRREMLRLIRRDAEGENQPEELT